MNDIPKSLSRYLSKIGKKGGKVSSEAKAKAARENAKKPRPGRRKKPAS